MAYRKNELFLKKFGNTSYMQDIHSDRQQELNTEMRLEIMSLQAILSREPHNKSVKDSIIKLETQLKPKIIKEPKIQKTKEPKIQKEPVKKKNISSTVKRLVWNTNIGELIGKSKCLCCNVTDITQMSFHCGHVIAEINGGETIVSNLKPICQNCNSSMGTKNMNAFMLTLK
jgi:hypothetical protein